RASGDPRAIALGQTLFFDARLSANGTVACSSCHVPAKAWTDGRARAVGLAPLDRNAPSLVNARLLRWFSWDGGAASGWSQALRAMLSRSEMGTSAAQIGSVLRADRRLACIHGAAFGAERDDTQAMVDAAKAIAAFVATLTSGRTPFDDFRDALARGERRAAARHPAAARGGVKVFGRQSHCRKWHVGPTFPERAVHGNG